MSLAFDPESIRRLRGGRSRAAFARMVGVTPQTVYRWELPRAAAEARSPRGVQLARIEELARETPTDAADLPPTAAQPPLLRSVPAHRGANPANRVLNHDEAPPPHRNVRLPPADASWVDDDVSRVLPALERVLHGDLRRGHAELVQLVSSAKALSANARGSAYFGIALCELLERSDPRAALLVITPLLREAEARLLNDDVAAKLFGIAALCHALPDALLFDLGRVHAYQSQVESLSSRNEPEAACIACIAALCGATFVGDFELLERAFSQLEEARWNALPPLLDLHVQEFRALRDMFAGKNAASAASCEANAARAEQHGYALPLSRSLGRLALIELDVLVDPEHVLAIARRAKAVVRGSRVGPGMHQLLAARAEVEALLRLGRIQEALIASDEVDAWSLETGVPALSAVTAQTRLFSLTGRPDAMTALAARLRSCELPSLRPICKAYALHVEACAAFMTDEDPAVSIALFEQVEVLAAHWPFLLREVLLYRVYAHTASGDEANARIALRRAQRFVDGFPSPWFTAHLRRLEGGLLTASGHWNEGRQLLQSSQATFELAKDRCDAVVTRYLYCLLENAIEHTGHEPQASLDAVTAELNALGITPPPSMQLGVARFTRQLRARVARASGLPGARGTEQLVVPFQRVAMRGVAPSLILSELVSVAESLFPGHAVGLAELDSAGKARSLFGRSNMDAPDVESVEFSDGAGRLLRLEVQGGLDHDQRSTLSLLTLTAALSLEVSVLRSIGERSSAEVRESMSPELPGFIAASAEMRKLRGELSRLANSRSTVIITGESGAGKELVARAIHDLSERASQPYVALNCATVPRELFEGQLFGYRRGAFTGATTDNMGVVRAANRGTLFLDEIAELPLDVQPKLLRFLENSEVFPLGERAPVRVDVRVLAATHRDLTALVRDGLFREDLYYRLQVVPVTVPPLRDRRADIPVLARHFLRQLTREGEPPVLAPDALAALLAERFPGNVRELKNTIERALAYFPDQPVLRAEHLRLPPRA